MIPLGMRPCRDPKRILHNRFNAVRYCPRRPTVRWRNYVTRPASLPKGIPDGMRYGGRVVALGSRHIAIPMGLSKWRASRGSCLTAYRPTCPFLLYIAAEILQNMALFNRHCLPIWVTHDENWKDCREEKPYYNLQLLEVQYNM